MLFQLCMLEPVVGKGCQVMKHVVYGACCTCMTLKLSKLSALQWQKVVQCTGI